MKESEIILLRANLKDHPEAVRLAYERMVGEKVAEKYNIRQEIAILRKKDRNPEEYAEWDAYVERCKSEIKSAIGMEN